MIEVLEWMSYVAVSAIGVTAGYLIARKFDKKGQANGQ